MKFRVQEEVLFNLCQSAQASTNDRTWTLVKTEVHWG